MGERSTHAVCHFNTPVESLTPMQLLGKAILLFPQMYVAAMKPTEFKTYMRDVRITVHDKITKLFSNDRKKTQLHYYEGDCKVNLRASSQNPPGLYVKCDRLQPRIEPVTLNLCLANNKIALQR